MGGVAVEIQVVKKDAFSAVGLRWEGTFAAAGEGEIRHVLAEMKRRLGEIAHKVNPDVILCAAKVNRPDGFTAYLCAEVSKVEDLPEGMVRIEIPAFTYAKTEHLPGENIQQTYAALYAWMEQEGYRSNQDGLTHLEEYPVGNNPYDPDPAFTILAPLAST
jgi:predicted transcriptional regulator YdeE